MGDFSFIKRRWEKAGKQLYFSNILWKLFLPADIKSYIFEVPLVSLTFEGSKVHTQPYYSPLERSAVAELRFILPFPCITQVTQYTSRDCCSPLIHSRSSTAQVREWDLVPCILLLLLLLLFPRTAYLQLLRWLLFSLKLFWTQHNLKTKNKTAAYQFIEWKSEI